MITTLFFRMRHPVTAVILFSMMLLSIRGTAFPQDPKGTPARITNQDWRIEGNVVTITYDLIGVADKSYVVAVALLRENDPKFKLVPRSVSGNTGIGKFAGTGRIIVWDYRRDVPQGLAGEGYYFELVVVEATGNGNSWLYYILGGVVAAGGTAGYILSTKSTAPSGTGTSELPGPPGRPNP